MIISTRTKKAAAAGALLLGGAAAGAAVATAGVASASVGSEGATTSAAEDRDWDCEDHRGPRPEEEPLSGAALEEVRAAVLDAYPGATVERAETETDEKDGADDDAAERTYEAHVVTADGERLRVLLDADATITDTEQDGEHGPGDHRGGPGGPPDGSAPPQGAVAG